MLKDGQQMLKDGQQEKLEKHRQKEKKDWLNGQKDGREKRLEKDGQKKKERRAAERAEEKERQAAERAERRTERRTRTTQAERKERRAAERAERRAERRTRTTQAERKERRAERKARRTARRDSKVRLPDGSTMSYDKWEKKQNDLTGQIVAAQKEVDKANEEANKIDPEDPEQFEKYIKTMGEQRDAEEKLAELEREQKNAEGATHDLNDDERNSALGTNDKGQIDYNEIYRNAEINNDEYFEDKLGDEEGCEYGSAIGRGGCNTTRDIVDQGTIFSYIKNISGSLYTTIAGQAAYDRLRTSPNVTLSNNFSEQAKLERNTGFAEIVGGIGELSMAARQLARTDYHNGQVADFNDAMNRKDELLSGVAGKTKEGIEGQDGHLSVKDTSSGGGSIVDSILTKFNLNQDSDSRYIIKQQVIESECQGEPDLQICMMRLQAQRDAQFEAKRNFVGEDIDHFSGKAIAEHEEATEGLNGSNWGAFASAIQGIRNLIQGAAHRASADNLDKTAKTFQAPPSQNFSTPSFNFAQGGVGAQAPRGGFTAPGQSSAIAATDDDDDDSNGNDTLPDAGGGGKISDVPDLPSAIFNQADPFNPGQTGGLGIGTSASLAGGRGASTDPSTEARPAPRDPYRVASRSFGSIRGSRKRGGGGFDFAGILNKLGLGGGGTKKITRDTNILNFDRRPAAARSRDIGSRNGATLFKRASRQYVRKVRQRAIGYRR